MTDACEKHCEATAFKITIRGLEHEVERHKKVLRMALWTLSEVQDETFRLIRIGQRLYAEEKVSNTRIAIKEILADPMREVQRLGQEIEQEPVCPECKAEVLYECVACSSNNYPPPQRTEQEPVAWVVYDHENNDVAWSEAGKTLKAETPLYIHPPQLEERNFCSRCGKRTKDLTHIHTCTPPQENT